MIELAGITKSYRLGAERVPVLHGIDLRIDAGDLVALTGASGSGKSTLMNILGCLDVPDAGEYRLDGQEVARMSEAELARHRNRCIGFVFQSFHLLPRLSAWANVAQPLVYRGVPPAARRAAAQQALQRVDMQHRADHKPNELSGGQRQRVAMARALVGAPRLVLADEPTGNLDSATAQGVLQLLQTLNRDERITMIVVTHEPEVAARCRRVVRLHDGRIVEDRPNRPAPCGHP